MSRPGGGLFGRPVTRESSGRFLILGTFFSGHRFHSFQSVSCPGVDLLLKLEVFNLWISTLERPDWVARCWTEILALPSSSCRSPHGRDARAHIFYIHTLSAFWINSGTLHFGDVGYDVRPQLAYDDEGVSFSFVAQSSLAMTANLLGRSACDPFVFIFVFIFTFLLPFLPSFS